MSKFENKYLAFCDIMGFKNQVLNNFGLTHEIYQEFINGLGFKEIYKEVEISMYSDSIIVVGNDLFRVCEAVQILQSMTLRRKWLVRGGIAYGRHWKKSDKNNLFVVSEALVKAVLIENTIKHPIICISSEITIEMNYWFWCIPRSKFDYPIIHYKGNNIVNPFHNYYFKSAEIDLNIMKNDKPEYSDKYDYIINMMDEIRANQTFIPEKVIQELLDKKMIEKKD